MSLLIFYVFIAIGVSFLCSILEAVLLSISPAYIASKEKENPKLAAALGKLKDNIDRPLAAILSLNTVAHTIGAAGAGAQAAAVFGDASLTVFSIILTLLILILSEIIPKTIGATFWKGLTPMVAFVLPWLMWSMWPLVKLSQGISWLMGGAKHGVVSRAEIAAMADIGQREGVVEEGESRIMRNLFRFDRLMVSDIMTPRTVVSAFDQNATVGDVVKNIDTLRFSRLPIFDQNIDQVTGFVLKNDILVEALKKKKTAKLSSMKRELLHVPATMHLRQLFEILVQDARHIALVQDKFGGTAGVVTLEDLVETLIGLEIVDEVDAIEDLQALAREKWKERAERLGLNTT